MKKKSALFASALWVLSSLWAVNLDAADGDEKGISKLPVELEIKVPSKKFYIVPLDGRQDVRQIRYDPIRKKFFPLRISYRFFNHNDQFIRAKLNTQAELTRKGKSNKIPLTVEISTVSITTNAATTIPGTKAMKQPKVEDIVISVVEQDSSPPPGIYQGTVSLIFESTIAESF